MHTRKGLMVELYDERNPSGMGNRISTIGVRNSGASQDAPDSPIEGGSSKLGRKAEPKIPGTVGCGHRHSSEGARFPRKQSLGTLTGPLYSGTIPVRRWTQCRWPVSELFESCIARVKRIESKLLDSRRIDGRDVASGGLSHLATRIANPRSTIKNHASSTHKLRKVSF